MTIKERTAATVQAVKHALFFRENWETVVERAIEEAYGAGLVRRENTDHEQAKAKVVREWNSFVSERKL